MGADYAAGRTARPYLSFRYRVRARLAVDEYLRRTNFGAEHGVLELGAADGRTLLEMRRLLGGVGKFDGVELSDELLAAAPSLPPNTHMLKGDVTKLPAELEEGTYTLVTALALLEHLDDPGACLREAMRMLRPGGVLVATCPHPVWDHVAGALKMVADEHHAQELDGPAMTRLATEAGFADVTFRPFMFSPVGFLPYLRLSVDPRRSLQIDRWVEKSAPWAGFTFVNQAVIARKPAK
jgi:SAM-dependent methyltransferase